MEKIQTKHLEGHALLLACFFEAPPRTRLLRARPSIASHGQ